MSEVPLYYPPPGFRCVAGAAHLIGKAFQFKTFGLNVNHYTNALILLLEISQFSKFITRKWQIDPLFL